MLKHKIEKDADVCAANRSTVTFKLNKADKPLRSVFAYVSTLLAHAKAKNKKE